MKYFVILIKKTTDDKSTKSIYEFGTENEAVARFHSSLGTSMNDETITECLCVVIDSFGRVYKNEVFVKENTIDEQ